MDNNKTMLPASRMKSFSYAVNGIVLLFKHEPNAKLHAIATVVGYCSRH